MIDLNTANKLLTEAITAYTQDNEEYAKGVLAALEIIEDQRSEFVPVDGLA